MGDILGFLQNLSFVAKTIHFPEKNINTEFNYLEKNHNYSFNCKIRDKDIIVFTLVFETEG